MKLIDVFLNFGIDFGQQVVAKEAPDPIRPDLVDESKFSRLATDWAADVRGGVLGDVWSSVWSSVGGAVRGAIKGAVRGAI